MNDEKRGGRDAVATIEGVWNWNDCCQEHRRLVRRHRGRPRAPAGSIASLQRWQRRHGRLGGDSKTRFCHQCSRAGRCHATALRHSSSQSYSLTHPLRCLLTLAPTIRPFTLRRSIPQPQLCSPTVAMTSPALTATEVLPTGSSQSGQCEASNHEDSPEYGEENSPSDDLAHDQVPKPQPLQKRRRVTRACDECRRKKIKCDGKQPCTHCTVYSYGKPHVHNPRLDHR